MTAPTILIVDDQPINVQLLRRKLEREGLQVVPAYSGLEALELINKAKPDLILLDVMMPDMDGIEVCRRLQAEADTRSIPVIFVTARTSKEGKIEGLSVGAVDYITKPIDLDETLARVQTQLRFLAVNRDMISLQRRLVDARRAATIGAVTQGIAHNLNNLLGVVIGHLDLIKVYYEKPDQVLKNAGQIESAISRIVSIIKQLSLLVVRTHPPFTKGNLQQLLEGSVARFQAENKLTAPVTIENPLGDLMFDTNFEVFEEALSKVLINAWESYGKKPDHARPITIRTSLVAKPSAEQVLHIVVEDQGKGIDAEIRDRVFEPFISTKHTVGVGMGLTITRHALRNLDGEVLLNDREGGGTSVTLVHPLVQKVRKSSDA
jgi:DNA-binding response OmpR family regulator/anti-sigma regulatory factor (Ser/Thr protein kinase)